MNVSVRVDLDAYVLPDDHTVFKFFPGEAYKFYDVIKQASIAIIDIRGLDNLPTQPDKWNDVQVLDAISEDRVARNMAKGADQPDRLVNSQTDKMKQTFLKGLLFEAQKGDLILMPQHGYTTDVLVGELVEDAGVVEKLRAKDGDETHTYYGRKVKWVGAIQKRLLGSDLIEKLHTPVAFFDVGESNYNQVYRLAFDNFIYDGQYVATFRTKKLIFTPKDSFLTSVWLELLEVLEEARENGGELKKDLSIYDLVIESEIDEEDRDDLSIYIQSPGWFRIRSSVASPLASLALFAMAVQGVSFEDARAATTAAKIVRDADSDCLGDVDASVRAYIDLLGKKRWQEACRLAKQAHTEATLKADARVLAKAVAKKEED